ncbi:MAG: class I SAM-dependent methyltransferase [Acidobacteriota bacterium]
MKCLAIALAIVCLLESLRLRGRLHGLQWLQLSNLPASPDYQVILAEGVVLQESVQRAASAHASQQGLDVLDLIPGNWPARRFLELSQLVDSRKYRRDRLARGYSAGHALLVRKSVLERLPQAVEWNGTPGPIELPRHQLLSLTPTLKSYACTATDMAVALELETVPDRPGHQRAQLEVVYGRLAAIALLGIPLALALLLGLATAQPLWGGMALAVFHLQPAIVLAGTPMAGWELALLACLRSPLELWRWWTLVTGLSKSPQQPDPLRPLRRRYRQLLADGPTAFFEPRVEACPLCRSRDLWRMVSSPDLIQHKPGTFVLEQCRHCGHIFQNPRLSPAGLDFYYRDFYDGLGEADLQAAFGFSPAPYLARAEMLQGTATPKRWLDVGGGQGHFCCVARDVWPETVFDALDLAPSVEEARRRGWVEHTYVGLFPQWGPHLKGAYDVVSMSHYLEHTREPREELASAYTVLAEAGYLLIEVPDPDYPLARPLGKWWAPWFQPQHQHLISTANMERLLREAGFTPLLWHTGRAHQTVDFSFMTYLLLNQVAGPAEAPWLPPMTRLARIRHTAVWALGLPFLAAAWMGDHAMAPFMKGAQHANAYRVLAQKRGTTSRVASSHPKTLK